VITPSANKIAAHFNNGTHANMLLDRSAQRCSCSQEAGSMSCTDQSESIDSPLVIGFAGFVRDFVSLLFRIAAHCVPPAARRYSPVLSNHCRAAIFKKLSAPIGAGSATGSGWRAMPGRLRR